MRIFEEMADERKIKKYGRKAEDFSVSHMLLRGRAIDYGIPIHKLLAQSDSREKFNDFVKNSLSSSLETDFNDFNLLMGLCMGCYNSYGYLHISQNVKKSLLNRRLSSQKTYQFLEQYQDAFCQFLFQNYQLSTEQSRWLLGRMKGVINDYSFYNSPVVMDVGRIILASQLLVNKEDATSFSPKIFRMISSGEMIWQFEELNDDKVKNSSVCRK